MVGGERGRDVLAFAGMVIVECLIVGGNTLYKSATAQGISSYVFTFYVFLIGCFFILPFPFILHRRTGIPPMEFSIILKIFLLSVIMYSSQILGYIGIKYSSPTLSSIISNLSPAFTFILALIFRMEEVTLVSSTSQAKIIGTIVSIAGALIATLYNGPLLLSSSTSMNWIIGGSLLAGQHLLISFSLVAQAKVLLTYSMDLMVVFVFGVCGLLVAGLAAFVMERDLESWKIEPNVVLAAILYMGFSSGFLSVAVQIWTLRVKGPVYVAMFKPLTIVIAIVMGVMFLGDSLHFGSVVGGVIITVGFYGVLWGKAKEESSPSTHLLEPHHDYDALEEGSQTMLNDNKYRPIKCCT